MKKTIIDLKAPDALAKVESTVSSTVDALMKIFGSGDQDAICAALDEQIDGNEPEWITARIFQAVIIELWIIAHAATTVN